MVDPTQQVTIDLCLGEALLGGSCHIWGKVRSGLHPADPCAGVVLSGGAALFFNSAICLSWSKLSPPPQPGGAENGSDYPWVGLSVGRIIRGSDCHSLCLDPLLRGRTEQFGGGQTVQSLWGRIVSICKCLWANHYSVGWCGSECHSV
jgi:hypothetical protein